MGALNPTALSDRSFGDKLLEPDGNFEKKGKRGISSDFSSSCLVS